MNLLAGIAAILQRWPALILLTGAALALPVLFHFDPAATALFPPCPVRLLTGWLCPGCGTLRALHQLLHGNFAAALALNPLLTLGAPALAFGLAGQARNELAGRPLRGVALPAGGAWALLAFTLAYAVARNTPLWPR